MTIEALKFIDDELNGAGVDYELDEMTKYPTPSTYFVGEFSDSPQLNEDGMQESTLILTGTSSSLLSLMEAKETIEELFPAVGGRIERLSNGSSVAIFFEKSLNIPTDAMDITRIQIELLIKEWKVK